ncbi:MAG: hydrolase [Lentisphaerae bacterium]|nr:hydrolase [Lentisphaerota bacterium]
MLKIENTVLVLVDVQERLLVAMHEREALVASLTRLLRGAAALGVPVVVTEQIPEKLGPTVPALAAAAGSPHALAKSCFSCAGLPAFLDRVRGLGRTQVILCGIEAHVCVYQTARDLLDAGYHVEVVADAVSSRSPENRRLALDRMAREGAAVTSVEMALFELQRVASGDAFKALLGIVK